MGIIASKLNSISLKICRNIKDNVLFYKKRIIIMIVFCFVSAFAVTTYGAYCENEGVIKYVNQEDGKEYELSNFTKTIYGWIKNIYGIRDDGTTLLDEVGNILDVRYEASDTPKYYVNGQILEINGINTIYRIFMNIGVMLTIVYFCIGLIEELSFNQMYMEKVLKKFIFLIIAMMLVAKGMEIVYGAADIGTAVTKKVLDIANQEPAFDIDSILNDLGTQCQSADTIDGWKNPFLEIGAKASDLATIVGFALSLIIPWAITMACTVIVQFTCWSRFFELTLMGLISPISFSDVSRGNPMQSNAMRAFKNLIAISMTGAIILLIVYLCNAISGQIMVENVINTNNLTNTCWNNVMISVVQAGMIKRSTELTKQALGMA